MNYINRAIVAVVKMMPKALVRIFANKYIAGDTLDDAVRVVRQFNDRGIMATIDVLGESITTIDEAKQAYSQGRAVLERINAEKLNANLSIKPTQFGLVINQAFSHQQISELLTVAARFNNFVRLDMEDSSTTDAIIHLYQEMRESHKNVGIVLQAYLHRTMADAQSLNRNNTNYRLCKGIYVESASIAFKGKQEIRDNFLAVLREMFMSRCYVGVATHDEYLIEETKKLVRQLGITHDRFEFQMLLGVRGDLRETLNNEGFRLRVYVPFGKDWYKYSIRRLQENPKVARDIFKNIFSLS